MSESPYVPAGPTARKRSPLVVVAVVVAVVVLGCAAWYAWGYFAAKGAVDAVKQATGHTGAGTYVDSPTPGAAEFKPLDIYNTDISQADVGRQLDVIMPILEQQRTASAEAWKSEQSAAFQQPNPDALSGKWREAQIIMNNVGLDGRTASYQSTAILGRNLLGGIYTPGTPSYKSVGKQIDNRVRLHDREQVLEVCDTFTTGTIGDYHANGRETVIIKTSNMNKTEEPLAQLVVSRVSSASGKYSAWLTEKVTFYGESGFIMDLNNWHPGS